MILEDIEFELEIPGGDIMNGMPYEEKRKASYYSYNLCII